MQRWVLILLFALAAVPAARTQTAQESPVQVTKTAVPEKRLDFEVTIPAAPAAVWEALTTSQGLTTWLWRDASVDLRVGGDWLAKYPGGATGGGTITAIVPGERLELQAMAPTTFPTVRRERTHAIFELRPSEDGKSTVVHLSQTGWKSGDEWDRAYEYLAKGNASLLTNLRQRFVTGPIDWDRLMGKKSDEKSAATDPKN